MNFSKLEKIMTENGVNSLAEIARALSTTPQAVSNWKARDQVPHRIAAKLNKFSPQTFDSAQRSTRPNPAHYTSPNIYEEDNVSFSDILLIIAQQLKVIVLTTFISVFLTFTYVQFVKQPKYVSMATVLLPENKTGNLGGLAGLASQFGVNVPTGATADLSSPSLYPELLRSRTFAEKILDKEFYLDKYGKELSLLAILTHGNGPPNAGRDTLVTSALEVLGNILEFDQSPSSTFSVIKVTASEPVFAKKLAEVALEELEALNRFFKSQMINEKTTFIDQRISAVRKDLETSEQVLKAFNEQNRQISSPALKLNQERLARDVEIQKGIYLTLKQQLELAKIEEVQEASIVQILDTPQIPLGPSNKNLKQSSLLAVLFGLGLGIILGFIRSYLDNKDIEERKKLRRIKHFIRKKIKDIILDRRVSGIVSVLMLISLPFYLGHESKNPIFFGMYSIKLMLVNIAYIIILLSAIGIFIHLTKKSKN
jgi:uncharacterized protein involved in exopolysaccharide biosynthesis